MKIKIIILLIGMIIILINPLDAVAESTFVMKIDRKDRNDIQVVKNVERKMCFDILQENPTSINGIYLVNPDGDLTAYPAKLAYCDMSGGGWTLYDDFGTKNITANAIVQAYNLNKINSIEKLAKANYETLITTINSPTYRIEEGYMHYFNSGQPLGYIQKVMPNWVASVRVDTEHTWYSGYNNYYFGSQSYYEESYAGRTEKILNGNGMLRLEETLGIVWIDAVWVK